MQKGYTKITNQSKVIHIRNIPSEIDELFIAFLAVPFGFIDKIVFLHTSQALIQMRDINDAAKMVNYFSKYIPRFYNKQIFIQFSKHQNMTRSDEHDFVHNANEERENYLSYQSYKSNVSSKILNIVVDNASQHQLDHFGVFKIFSRFGEIVRIILCTKNTIQYGLVEFADALSAHVAKVQLNGANVFGEEDIMSIDFYGSIGPLEVKASSDHARDYLKNPLNSTELDIVKNPEFDFPLFASCESLNENDDDIVSNINELLGHQFGLKSPSAVAVAAVSLLAASVDSRPLSHSVIETQMQNLSCNSNADVNTDNSIIIVTNLNPEKFNSDSLFNLFGIYGNILCIKIKSLKNDTALIQYVKHRDAIAAISSLNGLCLWGTVIHVKMCSMSENKLFRSNNEGQYLTMNYRSLGFHRYKHRYSLNDYVTYPPSPVLHLCFIPETVGELDLVALFQAGGYVVKRWKILCKDIKMVLLEMLSVEDAVHALMDFHNRAWPGNKRLRVSFSKFRYLD